MENEVDDGDNQGTDSCRVRVSSADWGGRSTRWARDGSPSKSDVVTSGRSVSRRMSSLRWWLRLAFAKTLLARLRLSRNKTLNGEKVCLLAYGVVVVGEGKSWKSRWRKVL